MTKQSVGEVASHLEASAMSKRVADPDDRRAKIIRLTAKGDDAYAVGRRLIEDVESEWAERYGEKRIAALRERSRPSRPNNSERYAGAALARLDDQRSLRRPVVAITSR